jgi:hypothetical protein
MSLDVAPTSSIFYFLFHTNQIFRIFLLLNYLLALEGAYTEVFLSFFTKYFTGICAHF